MGKYTLSAGDAALWRSRPQNSRYYIAVHNPAIMLAAQLTATQTSPTGSKIAVGSITAGALANVKKGMTLRIGSASGKYDYGMLRVRKDYISANTINTAEYGSGLINWQPNAYITVVEEYRPWAIHPQWNDTASALNVDYDAYTNQLSMYGPLAIMGPPDVGVMVGGKHIGQYVGNLSYAFTPTASITSQSWAFANGQTVTSALGASNAPINITYLNASPNGRINTLTVTDASGSSHIGQRLVFAFASLNQLKQVYFDSITGGLQTGGYRTRVYVYGSGASDNYIDGAEVVIFEQASYGTVGSSVGGNYPLRSNIVMRGWISDESVRIEPFTGEVSFNIETIDAQLRRTASYDQFLESLSAASSWDTASGLTIDKAALALLKYRSTVTNVTDFNPASGVAATAEIPYRDLPTGTIWDQLTYNYTAVLGMVGADLQSAVWGMTDAQVTGLSSNLVTIMEVIKQDRRDTVSVDHEHFDTNAMYRLYAIQGGSPVKLGAESPGTRTGYVGNRQEITANLTVSDQQTLITWAGNIRARANNPYKRITIPFAGNYRFDSIPQCKFTMTLSANDYTNKRGLDFYKKFFIPYETHINYDARSGAVTTEIVAEAIVDGFGGSSITFPTATSPVATVPTLPPDPPPPPPAVGDRNLVYVWTSNAIARTRNFLASSPNYSPIIGVVSGTIMGSILDPYDPANGAYTVTTTGVYHTTNLNDASPTWNLVLAASTVNTSISKTTTTFQGITGTIAQNSRIYVSWKYDEGGADNGIGASVTSDSGGTWDYHTVMNTNNRAVGQTFGVKRIIGGLISANTCYAVQGPAFGPIGVSRNILYKTTNGGSSWATLYDYAPLSGLHDFDICYGSVALAETYMYILYGGHSMLVSTDSGSSFTDLGQIDATGGGISGLHRIIMNVATLNRLDMMWIREDTSTDTTEAVWRTTDGSTFTQVATWTGGTHSDASTSGVTALGRWPYDANVCFWLEPNVSASPFIGYSTDGMVTRTNKYGDYASSVSGTFGTPVNIIPVWTS